MAKKIRYKAEQALYDIKVARKMIKKATEDLESSLESCESRIKWLEGRLDSQDEYMELEIQRTKEVCDSKLQDVIGSHVDEYLKGYSFERFVVQWMYKYFNEFELKIWQGDKCVDAYDGKKLIASWNMYPDLIFVNERKKQVIALECKYRYNGVLDLTKTKFEDYKRFEEQICSLMHVDVKVYIMIGCGGNAAKPNNMYRIPIDIMEEMFDSNDTCSIVIEDYPQYKVKVRAKIPQHSSYV